MKTRVWKDIEGYHIKLVYPAIPGTTRQEEQVYMHTFSESEFEELMKEMEKVRPR